jgi:hypothetical protein
MEQLIRIGGLISLITLSIGVSYSYAKEEGNWMFHPLRTIQF